MKLLDKLWLKYQALRMKPEPAPDVRAGTSLIIENSQLRAALVAHARWEADILTNADWSSGTPHLTQEQMDALTDVQEQRSAAMKKPPAPKQGDRR